MALKWTRQSGTRERGRALVELNLNDEGELQSKFKMPASAKVYHKSRQPRVMFLAVTVKPRPEYQFDGKVGNWPFTLTRKAQRSVKKNWHCSWSNLHTGKCVRDGGGVP